MARKKELSLEVIIVIAVIVFAVFMIIEFIAGYNKGRSEMQDKMRQSQTGIEKYR
ncbi:MAG TPA: hypothetical protein VG965_05285 [Patescibacteria group bacterium]|nr:hypothetical protein [Patescibacteria group bacterium]